MTSSDEQRKHPRTPLEVTVDWQVLGSTDVIWSATGDVGSGGLRIRTMSPPPVDTDVVVVLSATPPHGEAMRISGRVAWVRVDDTFCGMGVEFRPSNDEEKSRLTELLTQLTKKGAAT